jgi:hypothetical protein
MKSTIVAIIFASLVTYGNPYSPPAVSTHGPSMALATQGTLLHNDPDDEEDEHRVHPRKRISTRTPYRRNP